MSSLIFLWIRSFGTPYQLQRYICLPAQQSYHLHLVLSCLTALATMIAVTQQSGSQMGNAFKGILMNLRQVTGEVEDGGEAIDAESLTKYEKACADLGVSLSTVKDGVVSLKEPMQIIKELSDAYTKLDETDVKRANLLNAVGGKYRANALNSLLEHYDMYSKIMNEYANGLGSMDEEAEKTAQSSLYPHSIPG